MAGMIDSIINRSRRDSSEFVRALVQRYVRETGAIYVIYPHGSTNIVGPLYSASGRGAPQGSSVYVQVIGGQVTRVYP
jgi:hypothetical protein